MRTKLNIYPIKFITISIFLLFILHSCNNSDKKTYETKESSKLEESSKLKEERKTNILSMLGTKHNAIKDWEKVLYERNIVFTADLEKILVNSDNKPIIFVSQLVDIKKQNGKYFMQFQRDSFSGLLDYLSDSNSTYLEYLSESNIRFILECDLSAFKNEFDKFDKENKSKDYYLDLGEFVVVARIETVKKAFFKLVGSLISDEYAEIEIELPNIFIAKGYCLDLVYIENKK